MSPVGRGSASRLRKDGFRNAAGRFPAAAGRQAAQRDVGSISRSDGLHGPVRAGGSAGGEDVAAVSLAGEDTLVLKSDPITFATDAVGYYAMVVNANDLATSGARPRWMLATLLFPPGRFRVESARS